MMTRKGPSSLCAPRPALSARSNGMQNCAFCLVLVDLGSSSTAAAGTPLRTSSRLFCSASPAPLTIIVGASPDRKSSAARVGRSPEPPPKTTSASACTGPLSTHRICCGKAKARSPPRARRAARARRARFHGDLGKGIVQSRRGGGSVVRWFGGSVVQCQTTAPPPDRPTETPTHWSLIGAQKQKDS